MSKETFDFDFAIDRRQSDSIKWTLDAQDDVLPMWVADMDFAVAPCIKRALQERLDHGVFGYVAVDERYYQAVEQWYARRHNQIVHRDEIIVTTGVLPAISAILKALTVPGDKVLVQTPAYNCFFRCITLAGCEVLANPLQCVNGSWQIDWDDLAEKLKQAKILLLSNPHNPCARCWTREELVRIAQMCRQAGVTVISDEIHGEFVFAPHRFVPWTTIEASERPVSVVCTAASKTFNLAGLQNALMFVEDAQVRERIRHAVLTHEVRDVNPFGMVAARAAFEQGEPWLEALLAYLQQNDQLLRNRFAQECPECVVSPLEATYLEWVDCTALGVDSETIAQHLLEHEHVRINAGAIYHETAQHSFIRINIATTRALLDEGLTRILRGLKSLKA